MLQPRGYGLDGPAMNPALPGLTGLPAGARARGSSALEDPSLAGLSGLAPARASGPSPLEELDVVGRSSSLGTGVGIPDVEHHSPTNLDGPSEDGSNIIFVDCLPTDCTRREVARILPSILVFFCIIFPYLCKFHFACLDFCWKICFVLSVASRTSE